MPDAKAPPGCKPLTEAEARAAEAAFRARPRDSVAVKGWQARLGVTADGHPGPLTWAALDDARPDVRESFPLAALPPAKWSYRTGMRAFGANRSKGRAHAGVDLYAPEGTPVYAVADGIVTRAAYPFYASTDALEIDHGAYLVRYGEVKPGSSALRVGQRVRRGEVVARIGRLVGIAVPSPMLHVEVYDKTASGPLTVTGAGGKRHTNGRPFYRRRDLTNPTPYLDRWAANLPRP